VMVAASFWSLLAPGIEMSPGEGFVKAEIITESKIAMALPENAIVESDNEYYVLVLDEENEDSYFFNQIKVQTGNTANGYTQIIDHQLIAKTKKVITRGAFSLIGNE